VTSDGLHTCIRASLLLHYHCCAVHTAHIRVTVQVVGINFMTGTVSEMPRHALLVLHGVLLFLSWGVCIPVGVIIARSLKFGLLSSTQVVAACARRLLAGLCVFVFRFTLPCDCNALCSQTPKHGPMWLRISRVLQMVGVVSAIAGALVGIAMVDSKRHFAHMHAAFGLTVTLLGVMRPLLACCRSRLPLQSTSRKVKPLTLARRIHICRAFL
jgi:hypothetical protein